mmetsp:Transcript_7348/g.23493  ORF Transcript_7348/g.23493 Transcript_7348/m.23493 type:complete len:251 (-) Transcript_7348:280-1032(-)
MPSDTHPARYPTVHASPFSPCLSFCSHEVDELLVTRKRVLPHQKVQVPLGNPTPVEEGGQCTHLSHVLVVVHVPACPSSLVDTSRVVTGAGGHAVVKGRRDETVRYLLVPLHDRRGQPCPRSVQGSDQLWRLACLPLRLHATQVFAFAPFVGAVAHAQSRQVQRKLLLLLLRHHAWVYRGVARRGPIVRAVQGRLVDLFTRNNLAEVNGRGRQQKVVELLHAAAVVKEESLDLHNHHRGCLAHLLGHPRR